MNADATAGGDESDDGVAGNRVAAVGHPGQDIADSADAEIAGVFGPPAGFGGQRIGTVKRRAKRRQRPGKLEIIRADGRQHVISLVKMGLAGDFIVAQVFHAEAGQFAFDHGAPVGQVLVVFGVLEPLRDSRAGAAGADVTEVAAQPVAAWMAVFDGLNLHLLAAFQPATERRHFAVDACATGAVPDLGMDRVGEVDWG